MCFLVITPASYEPLFTLYTPVGEVTCLVRALMLVGMRRDPTTGALHHMFGEEHSVSDVTVCGQLVMRRLQVPDARFAEQPPQGPEVRGPIRVCMCICMCISCIYA